MSRMPDEEEEGSSLLIPASVALYYIGNPIGKKVQKRIIS